MSTNKWLLFLEYAKDHPDQVPRDNKKRAELYRHFLEACRCNAKSLVCARLGIKQLKNSKSYNPENDPLVLKARIQAYEEILADKDKYVQELETFIKRRSRSRATA